MSVKQESAMARAIRKCGREGGSERTAEGTVRAWEVYEFPEDFAGFAGHFPGSPLVPGVCLIAAALQTLDGALPRPWELAAVRRAKYFLPVSPGMRLRCEAEAVAGGGGGFTIHAVIAAAAGEKEQKNTVAKLQMTGRFL